MKQAQFDKHMIAWFKIADCVSRGEKERALGVYRLLSHSFNDNAVARQLEGDIYLSFNEYELAIPLYQQATELYQKSERYLQAVAVCEHLIAIRTHDVMFKREAIKLYVLLGNEAKAQMHTAKVLDILLATGQDHQVQEFLAMLSNTCNQLYEYAMEYIE